jgi:hypothetical protein
MLRRLNCVTVLSVLVLMLGCTTTPKLSAGAGTFAAPVAEGLREKCTFIWKGLADSRPNTDSLGRIGGQQVLYPDFSGEIDRRINSSILFNEDSPSERPNRQEVISVWGELMRAEVRESISQLEMGMAFSIHHEGETETLMNITTSVKRATITPEERLGIRFIGPAIDESVEQFISSLQEACGDRSR